MKAAAENLVPVTLELGGKSPVLVGRSADIRNAAERIAVGKAQNSGQLCVAPDTVWVAREQLEAFVAAVREFYAGLYPTIAGNPTSRPRSTIATSRASNPTWPTPARAARAS
jgi:coniferyl-aldehyde dehydrogenase